MKEFDPNAAATEDSGIFGLPFTESESALVYLPIPWEATTSYGGGTSQGPTAIFEASHQVDLFDLEIDRPYQAGLYFRPEDPLVRGWNEEAKTKAQKIIAIGGNIGNDHGLARSLVDVNSLSQKLNKWTREQTSEILAAKKIPALIGGDHSVPLGAFHAIAAHFPSFGILHFDAHSDTRQAYEGFTYSHASIMYNALQEVPQINKLVQVGIRDFCEEEFLFCESQGPRVRVFYDTQLQRRKYEGQGWARIADEIVAALPREVWVSFDIDGLDPRFCPHTGTPVPGGIDFQEACFVLGALYRSGRKIIGFDLNEVAPNPDGSDEWDANVGARLLYKMTGWTLASQGKAKIR